MKRFALHPARRRVHERGDGEVVRRRTEPVRIGRVDEIIEHLGEAHAYAVTSSDFDERLSARDGHFAVAEQADLKLTAKQRRSIVRDVGIEAVEALVDEKDGTRLKTA